MPETFPVIDHEVTPFYSAPDGSVFVHKDLAHHVAPFKLTEHFGDLESWVSYIKGYAVEVARLLTWNADGFRAQLDYQTERQPSGTWEVDFPFVATPQWLAWQHFATGHAVAHKAAVEFLEDHSPDIIEPDAAGLLALLRTLRGNVNTTAATELRPDGTSHITFERNQRVTAGGEVDLPSEFTIGLPIFVGDPEAWKLVVRVRVNVSTESKLEFRFSMPQAEQVLETVYAERVAKARELLGEDFPLLRAAD